MPNLIAASELPGTPESKLQITLKNENLVNLVSKSPIVLLRYLGRHQGKLGSVASRRLLYYRWVQHVHTGGQKIFLNPQNHHKSTSRPNFAILLNSFDIKTNAQPHATFRIA